jgi:hypothetical protein
MKRILFALIAVAFVFQSCSDNKAAFDFNQKLAGISETLNKKGTELGYDLKTAMTTRDFTKVKDRCNELKTYIDEKITEVKGTKDVGGSEKLKTAMLDFLNFENELVADAFVPFGKMDQNTTEEEMQTALDNMQEKTKEENNYLVKVQEAQKEFAEKNGFKLEAAKK